MTCCCAIVFVVVVAAVDDCGDGANHQNSVVCIDRDEFGVDWRRKGIYKDVASSIDYPDDCWSAKGLARYEEAWLCQHAEGHGGGARDYKDIGRGHERLQARRGEQQRVVASRAAGLVDAQVGESGYPPVLARPEKCHVCGARGV